jgi:hypothetical protein
MAGEKVTATKRKAGGKQVIKKRAKKFRRHQSDQFMRVPVRAPPRALCCRGLSQSVLSIERASERAAAAAAAAGAARLLGWLRYARGVG